MEEKKEQITIDDLAAIVKSGFDDMGSRMATKEDLKGFATKEDLKAFATKEDLKGFATKEDLGSLRSDMIDYIAKQNIELKTDLVLILRGGDKKFFSLMNLLVERSVISKEDANKITKLEPFPQSL